MNKKRNIKIPAFDKEAYAKAAAIAVILFMPGGFFLLGACLIAKKVGRVRAVEKKDGCENVQVVELS